MAFEYAILPEQENVKVRSMGQFPECSSPGWFE